MPRSKHRRKAGGKSVKRPGSNRPERRPVVSTSEAAWRRFIEAYCEPFHQQWPDGAGCAGEMLDLVADAIFDVDTLTFRAVNKDVIFLGVLEPFEQEDENPVILTTYDADAALRFLAEQNMVVIDGDLISIHPRFVDVITGRFASDDETEGTSPVA